jgi:hypothetical protein
VTLSVFTNGLTDERFEKAAIVLQDDNLSSDQKLKKIHALIPFPATVSADKLGKLIRVTKQAILKGDWWKENRKGEKENEVGRRHQKHKERAKQYEVDPNNDED